MTTTTTTTDATQPLRQLREFHLNEVARIDQALAILEGVSSNFAQVSTQASAQPRKRKYSEERLDKLVSQAYNPDWTYTDKILFFLRKYGKMRIVDMADKIVEMYPKISDKDLKDQKVKLGYQAKMLADKGYIERDKDSPRIQYWLPE